MLKVSEGDKTPASVISAISSSLAVENWKERQSNEGLSLGMTSEIYLLERVLQMDGAMVTSES